MSTALQPATRTAQHRFHLLDALRGLAAILVMEVHMAPSIRAVPVNAGFLAVDFFFCLSGFVIAFAYEKRLADRITLHDFAVVRWIRLYPLYLLGTIFGVAVTAFENHQQRAEFTGHWPALLLLGLLMIPDLAWQFPFPFNKPSWSLFAELCLNFAYAALVRLRLARTAILVVCMAVSLVPLVLHVSAGRNALLDVGHFRGTILLGFARAGFAFPAGVLAYRLYTHVGKPAPDAPASPTTAQLGALLITAIFLFALMSPFALMESGWVELFFAVILFPTLVYLGARIRLPHRWSTACSYLGDLSYPLYAIHFSIVGHWPTFDHLHNAYPRASMLSFPVTAIVLGMVSHWLGTHFDIPARKFLTRRYNLLRQNP